MTPRRHLVGPLSLVLLFDGFSRALAAAVRSRVLLLLSLCVTLPNGWHSAVTLAAARPIVGGAKPATVRRDLDAPDAAGATATGSNFIDVSIAGRRPGRRRLRRTVCSGC